MTDIEAVLQKLTLEEKVTLVSGASFWRTFPITGADVPILKVSDGPNGVRGDGGVPAASFPVGICMAATWNTDLLQRIGDAVAEEALSKDVQVVLGPTINIHRTPLGGRNFECYSEDPLLSGRLAAAFTNGIQSRGVGACLKHYVCNDSEFERHTLSVEVDERTLREIYLRPFEIALKSSHPWTVMAAYNRINGDYACSHDRLINQILKGEWDYDGLVISDWFAAKETVANALGGLDLEMPGPTQVWGKALLEAIAEGAVGESLIDDKVRRLLRVIERTHRFEHPDEKPEQGVDNPAHRQTAYQAAAEGMVLLKNTGVLPLSGNDLKSIAVVGPNAAEFRIMGGGSSALKPHPSTTVFEALKKQWPAAEIRTVTGCHTHKFIPAPAGGLLSPEPGGTANGLKAQFYADAIGSDLVAERLIRSSTVHIAGQAASAMSATLEGWYDVQESGLYEFGLLSTGKSRMTVNDELIIDNWDDTEAGEAFFTQATTEKRSRVSLKLGDPAHLKIEFAVDPEKTFKAFRYGILTPQPEDGIAEAVELATAADAVILMVGTNDDWETEGNDRETLALPGAQNELVDRVLAANSRSVVVNNSGSPVAMPWLDKAPAVLQSWFAGQEAANALVDILSGTVNPSGKLPISFPKRLEDTPAYTSYPGEFGRVHYGEGIFVGYRWYSSRDIEPLFSFGHGLSYTTFDYSKLQEDSSQSSATASISFKLRNTGDRDGQEIVQVYVEALDSPVQKPRIELKGFHKADLRAGQEQTISMVLDTDSFAHWDVAQSEWVTAPGRYRIHVGSSSTDLRLSVVVRVQ